MKSEATTVDNSVNHSSGCDEVAQRSSSELKKDGAMAQGSSSELKEGSVVDDNVVQGCEEKGDGEVGVKKEQRNEGDADEGHMSTDEEDYAMGDAGGHIQPPLAAHVNCSPTRRAGAAGSAWDSDSGRLGFQMDGRDQQQQPPPQQPQQQQQAAPRVGSPAQGSGGGVMMPPHAAFGAAPPGIPPGAANVMHGMPLGFNPMASQGASTPMKPADMPPGALYRPDTGAPGPGMQHPGAGSGGAAVGGSGGELVKKKRGRPRKYGPDGSVGLGMKPAASTEAGGQSGGGGSNSNPDGKRRGRPPGSGKKKQLDALGSSGTSFTPHIITVKPNEDVAAKIMAFSQQGPRTTCIISANGSLCTATLRQPATSGGIVTYEGYFDILSLSGSFLLAEDGDTRSRTGGLSVALAGSDGRIVGGCVAGMLMAATPVQVIVGSFIAESKKPKEEQPKREPISVPPHTAGFGAATAASPPSDGTSSEHSDDPGSPLGPNGSTFTNTGHPMHSSYAPVAWSLSGNQGRYDPDMKMMTD